MALQYRCEKQETSGITQQCVILFKTERRKVVRQYRKMAKQNRNKNDSHSWLLPHMHWILFLLVVVVHLSVRTRPGAKWLATFFVLTEQHCHLQRNVFQCGCTLLAAGCCPWIFVAQVDAPSFSFFCTRKEAHLLESRTTSNRQRSTSCTTRYLYQGVQGTGTVQETSYRISLPWTDTSQPGSTRYHMVASTSGGTARYQY